MYFFQVSFFLACIAIYYCHCANNEEALEIKSHNKRSIIESPILHTVPLTYSTVSKWPAWSSGYSLGSHSIGHNHGYGYGHAYSYANVHKYPSPSIVKVIQPAPIIKAIPTYSYVHQPVKYIAAPSYYSSWPSSHSEWSSSWPLSHGYGYGHGHGWH